MQTEPLKWASLSDKAIAAVCANTFAGAAYPPSDKIITALQVSPGTQRLVHVTDLDMGFPVSLYRFHNAAGQSVLGVIWKRSGMTDLHIEDEPLEARNTHWR